MVVAVRLVTWVAVAARGTPSMPSTVTGRQLPSAGPAPVAGDSGRGHTPPPVGFAARCSVKGGHLVQGDAAASKSTASRLHPPGTGSRDFPAPATPGSGSGRTQVPEHERAVVVSVSSVTPRAFCSAASSAAILSMRSRSNRGTRSCSADPRGSAITACRGLLRVRLRRRSDYRAAST